MLTSIFYQLFFCLSHQLDGQQVVGRPVNERVSQSVDQYELVNDSVTWSVSK